jgi:hypothetical protein
MARKPDEAAARRDLTVERRGEPGHELVVAAPDMEALIRILVGREAVGGRSRKQTDHGDRADFVGSPPVTPAEH